MRPISVLATVTGKDRPGVAAAFFGALAAHDVDVRDVEQVLIRDRLVLSVLVELRGDLAALRNSATATARVLGMECEVTVADSGSGEATERAGTRAHVIVLGRPLRPGSVSYVTQRIADLGDNIDSITQLVPEPVAGLELIVRTADLARLRVTLMQAAAEIGVDIAVERAVLQRLAKRLVLLEPNLEPTEDVLERLHRHGYDVGVLGADPADQSVPMEQTVAVASALDDASLLAAAGMVIAVNAPQLDSVLFVLGIAD